MTSEQPVREKAIEVAARLGIKKIVPRLVLRVSDSQASASSRAVALASLSRLDPAQAVTLAKKIKPLPANELTAAALTVLARHDLPQSLSRFVEATQSRDSTIRQLGWDTLAKSDSPEARKKILQGVQAYLEGKLPPDVQLNVLEAAQGKLNEELAGALAQHDETLAENDALAPWLASLEGGNAERGRKQFFFNDSLACIRCHKVDQVGGDIGPNLTIIGKQRNKRFLLESICMPDRNVGEQFETATIMTVSGDSHFGIVGADQEDHVRLVGAHGVHTRIPVASIVTRHKDKSLMPDDLPERISPRQLRDLVAYLASLQRDPSENP